MDCARLCLADEFENFQSNQLFIGFFEMRKGLITALKADDLNKMR